MKLKFLKMLSFCFLLTAGFILQAQNKKISDTKNTDRNYPASFLISKAEFDELFNYKIKEVINNSSNKYLDKSEAALNTKNGDILFLKLKLNYFKNAFLLVQVNGEYSTQVFIMSTDKSVFYKGRIEKDKVVMTRCREDEIVSE